LVSVRSSNRAKAGERYKQALFAFLRSNSQS
jgi:hypothetical protein